MKLAVIGFSREGCRYAKKITGFMRQTGHECTAWGKGREARDWQVQPVEESLGTWTGEQFASCDALIFIGAAGIAVRAIAPFVKSKAEDPAVLCMDDQANYVISLLSGHLGGANELAGEVASLCSAVPVITTATDVGKRFSVDDYARRASLYQHNLALAKRISAEILENRVVGLHSEFEVSGRIPKELSLGKGGNIGISIALDDACSIFPETLHLVPRITVLGIGCRKGASKEQIADAVGELLGESGISMHSIVRAASIDLKKEEPGLLEFCRDLGVPLLTYSREELEPVICEDGFSESEFVQSVTGVGNVCERCALKASGQKKLFKRKQAKNGVTAAAALTEYRVRF